MKKSNLKIRRIEWIFAFVVLFICTIVLGKYLVLSVTGNDLLYGVEKEIVKVRNLYQERKKQESVNRKAFTLENIQNSDWKLYEGGVIANDFEVINNGGKVAIKKMGDKREFNFEVDNVRDYFTRTGQVDTDIPYNYDEQKTYFIQEQEDLFPIIGYHNVFENENDIVDPYIDMRESDFNDQIQFLNEKLNCRWITFSDILEKYILKEIKIPRNSCVMTFDDGRKNNFKIILPILQRNNIIATFNVIAGRLGQKSYMTNWEVSTIYHLGNEIGSHSLTGGSLIDTSWYTKGPFTQDVLWDQLYNSKGLLSGYGYNVKTFAYPLGDYNKNIISTIQNAGYIGARASKKNNPWRDPRALSTSMDNEYVWHLNYYEPELKLTEDIYQDISYNGYWQFEEGLQIVNDINKNVRILTQSVPTKQSYGVVLLEDQGDSITNSFILGNSGSYLIDIFASNSKFRILIDGVRSDLVKDSKQDCTENSDEIFCHYLIKSNLVSGKHLITVENEIGKTTLDRFSIMKILPSLKRYNVTIEEY